jgi:hypothetical protein
MALGSGYDAKIIELIGLTPRGQRHGSGRNSKSMTDL